MIPSANLETHVRNIKLVIEYDGTEFCGWQRQPKVRTAEGELLKALKELLGFEPEIIAAARTDSGVHAIGQVVNLSIISNLSTLELGNALNRLLPHDIRIISAEDVPLSFNARFDAVTRVYRYEIITRPTSIWRRYRWFVKWQLDIDLIKHSLNYLIGDHDFSGFTCSDEDRSPWITLKEAKLVEIDPDSIGLIFSANRFLRKMVRIITGTLVEVGRGRLNPEDVYEILVNRDRRRAGPAAPPHGLYLVRVDY